MDSTNDYSSNWFDIFLDTYPTEYTDAEIRFIEHFLPQSNYPTVLDICCGRGRHAHLLAAHGYKVTAIDINSEIISQAQNMVSDNPNFIVHDMRNLDAMPDVFDGAINMWQSFGYFDDATNVSILKSIHQRLKVGGRFIIDIYNRNFFVDVGGEHQFRRANIDITERKSIRDKRLTVELDYENSKNVDRFSWQIYTPDEFEEVAIACGFSVLAVCTNTNLELLPSSPYPRMQFVLQK